MHSAGTATTRVCCTSGAGASLGFPVALSAAGDSGEDSAVRVAFAATVGCVAFLVGPPTLGFLGEHFGLRQALLVVLALVAAAAFAAPAARPPAREEDETPQQDITEDRVSPGP